MDKELRVKHLRSFDERPLCIVRNLPGMDAYLYPDQMRALADALYRAAEECEAIRASCGLPCERKYLLERRYGHGEVLHNQVCVGDRKCLDNLQKAEQSGNQGDGDASSRPRVAWHGTHFRDQFYQQRLPEKFAEYPSDHERIQKLTLFSFLYHHQSLHSWFARRHKDRCPAEQRPGEPEGYASYFPLSYDETYAVIQQLTLEQVREELKAAAIETTLRGFSENCRHLAADLAGIDLSSEWSITGEYLKKKTKAEIVTMGEQLGIFEDSRAQAFLCETLNKKRGRFDTCKKPELIRVFLESGVELTGKVPQEILQAGE